MNKKIVILLKCFGFALLWSILLIALSIVINIFSNFIFEDILFCGGIISIMIGSLFSMEGSPSTLPIQQTGLENSQYVANTNLEMLRMARYSTKTNINLSFNTLTLMLAGFICISISYII